MKLAKIGSVLTNEEMRIIHSVSTQGGMRRGLKTNSLVLTTSLESTYSDRWENDVLHYTGMGLEGDQRLISQNKTLYESKENGVQVWLYEKLSDNNYQFHGQYELTMDPYQEIQEDQNGTARNVWMFPIRPISIIDIPTVPKSLLDKELVRQAIRAKKLSQDALIKQARKDSGRAKKNSRAVTTTQHYRSQAISNCVKYFANGKCDLCNNAAPFLDSNDQPYLECHHILWLAQDGLDTLENTVALCPNCHRKMHGINLKEDRRFLSKIVFDRFEEIKRIL